MKSPHSSTLKSVPYGNYKVYHPDGELMFRCKKERTQWYIDRNLAKPYGKNAIQLTFIPKGKGEIKEHLIERKNICVVSGDSEKLTKHHIIPYCFRKHLPLKYKSRNSIDVVLLRRDIHDEYEKIAEEVKKELIDRYVTTEEKNLNRAIEITQIKMKSLDRVINNDALSYRVVEVYCQLKEKLNSMGFFISDTRDKEKLDFYKIVAERMGNEELILFWKNHFYDTLSPDFLPDFWNPNYISVKDNP